MGHVQYGSGGNAAVIQHDGWDGGVGGMGEMGGGAQTQVVPPADARPLPASTTGKSCFVLYAPGVFLGRRARRPFYI